MEHKLVNWVEGMNVSKAHLIQTENYFLDALRAGQTIHLTNYNYGLLPVVDRDKPSNDIRIGEQATNRVEIVLRRCHASTAGGHCIDYDPDEGDYIIGNFAIEPDKENSAGNHAANTRDIVLGINPFKRIPTGEPDAEETPPRHPDAEPAYTLSVMPAGEIIPEKAGKYYLIIGRIRYAGQRWEVDGNYIPPCTTMSGYPDLLDYNDKFSTYLAKIELASKNIISKVQNQQKTSDIAVSVNAMCRDIMRYISTIYFSYRNMGKYMEPVRVVDCFASLAHICLCSLGFINKTGKEELLKYFYDWNNVSPGAFENILSETASIIYNHNSIRESMLNIERFLNIFAELWTTLSNLEYIGQTKENIVVTVKSGQQEVITNTWSVID